KLRMIVIEADSKKLLDIRRKFVALDQYGSRITILHGDPTTFHLPPYLASLVVAEDPSLLPESTWPMVFESLRPFGGVACFYDHPQLKGIRHAVLNNPKAFVKADVERKGPFVLMRRVGQLPGSANWTNEHADPANTRVSRDQIVKAPLGVLWF